MFAKLQRSIIFPREYAVPDPNPGAGVAGLQKSWLQTDQGAVESWYLPAPNARVAVMFAHGNAELIDHWPRALQPYRDLGVSVLLGEYRGYGRSEGSPTQDRIVADFVAMYDALVAQEGIEHIMFHGRSLGGAVVAQLAAQRAPDALVLESTFTSIAAMASMLPRALVSDPFDTESVLQRIEVPSLVFHGRNDSVIPFAHAEKLAMLANAKLVGYDADHNDFPPDPAPYWAEIEGFLLALELI